MNDGPDHPRVAPGINGTGQPRPWSKPILRETGARKLEEWERWYDECEAAGPRFFALVRGNPGARQLFARPWAAYDSKARIEDGAGFLRRAGWTEDDATALMVDRFPGGTAGIPLVSVRSVVRKYYALCAHHEAQQAAQKAEARAKAATLFNPWEEPKPPEWPGGVLSRRTEETLAAISLRDGVDYAAQSIAYICAASGAAPKNIQFAPYKSDGDGWSVPPIIWLMIIAESGQRKTAIMETAFRALRTRHTTVWTDYLRALKEWRALPSDERHSTPKPVEPHSRHHGGETSADPLGEPPRIPTAKR